MKLAHSLGISHRRLLGWEAGETVSHEYDGDRLIRSTVTRESEWSPYERSLMLAFQSFEDRRGPNGFLLSEELDPEVKFTAEAVTNHATAAVDNLRAQYKKDYPDDPQHGVFFVARKP